MRFRLSANFPESMIELGFVMPDLIRQPPVLEGEGEPRLKAWVTVLLSM
jgi:hypothetical protein